MIDTKKHQVTAENAEKIWGWFQTRSGIAIWPSVNLSNPGASWTTPRLTEEGKPYEKPTWQAGNEPRIISDPNEVEVTVDQEVKRFRVAVRRGAQGFTYKVTDAGSARIRKEVAKAGDGAYHVFDYSTQEAVIMKPSRVVSLPHWITELKKESEER